MQLLLRRARLIFCNLFQFNAVTFLKALYSVEVDGTRSDPSHHDMERSEFSHFAEGLYVFVLVCIHEGVFSSYFTLAYVVALTQVL